MRIKGGASVVEREIGYLSSASVRYLRWLAESVPKNATDVMVNLRACISLLRDGRRPSNPTTINPLKALTSCLRTYGD